MVDQKTPGLRYARSKADTVVGIKIGLLLLLLALYIQGSAIVVSYHFKISISEFYEKVEFPTKVSKAGLACIAAVLSFAVSLGIKKCFRPLNPRIFDLICLGLDWLLGILVDLVVSCKTNYNLCFALY